MDTEIFCSQEAEDGGMSTNGINTTALGRCYFIFLAEEWGCDNEHSRRRITSCWMPVVVPLPGCELDVRLRRPPVCLVHADERSLA